MLTLLEEQRDTANLALGTLQSLTTLLQYPRAMVTQKIFGSIQHGTSNQQIGSLSDTRPVVHLRSLTILSRR